MQDYAEHSIPCNSERNELLHGFLKAVFKELKPPVIVKIFVDKITF